MKQKTERKKLNLKMPYGYSLSIHVTTIVLNLFGLLMIVSASMNLKNTSRTLTFTLVKEIAFIVVSYILMVIFAKYFKMSFFKKYFWPLLGLTIAALLATLAFGEVNGAQAWIRFGSVTIQPAEFAKVFVILMIALFLGDRKAVKSKSVWDYILLPTLVILLMLFIITVLQSDLGSAVVLLGIAFVCYLIPSNIKLKRMQLMFAILFVLGIVVLVMINNPQGAEFLNKLPLPDYMVKRFLTSADPLHDMYNDSYQVFNSLVAIIQGGVFGKGFAQSINKYGYIPEAHTDFILAIIIEELGILGFLVIFIGYGLILINLMKYSFKVRSEQDKIILVGVASYIVIHFVFNVGGITAFIPLTGVPLLLVSSGGSSRMAVMIAIGLAQSVISKHNTYEKRKTLV